MTEKPNHNEEQFYDMLRKIDPQLFLIKRALVDTDINPDIIPRIIRTLGNLNIGTGWGEIVILIKERTVTQIKGVESDIVNMSVDKRP